VAVKVLADENVPAPAVTALRQHGHDVVWMHEDAPGTPDPNVLARAQREGRVVITFDKDFGELAFRVGAAAAVGVILFASPRTRLKASRELPSRLLPSTAIGPVTSL